jgi:hypothetical protein
MSSASKPPVKTTRIQPANGVEVLEKNTETTWALFQSLMDQQQRGFVETAPAGPDTATAAPRAPSAVVTLDEARAEIRKNNRVCPLPSIWKKLYDALPNKSDELAAAPVTAEEWKQTPALEKRSRLRQHIEWADTQGVLRQVYKALHALPENKWHHMGE